MKSPSTSRCSLRSLQKQVAKQSAKVSDLRAILKAAETKLARLRRDEARLRLDASRQATLPFTDDICDR